MQVSVIHGRGTYGGYFYGEKDKGLLEAYSETFCTDDNDPIGYLTAEEIMKRLKVKKNAKICLKLLKLFAK